MKAILALSLVLAACSANVETPSPSASDTVTRPVSCELIDRSDAETVVKFSDPDIAAPGGTACVSLGGGVFDCKPTWCTAVLYAAPSTGNACPDCPGGGE